MRNKKMPPSSVFCSFKTEVCTYVVTVLTIILSVIVMFFVFITRGALVTTSIILTVSPSFIPPSTHHWRIVALFQHYRTDLVRVLTMFSSALVLFSTSLIFFPSSFFLNSFSLNKLFLISL